MEVYLNGRQVFQESGWLNDYEEQNLADDYKNALHPGRNVIAIHCANTDGPGYIDAGLSVDLNLVGRPLVADARTFPTQWSYVAADPGSDQYSPNTPWTDTDIWLRTQFKLDALSTLYQLGYRHDDDMEVYLNGNPVAQRSGYASGYDAEVSDAVAKAIKVGDNTLAVHCANVGSGGQRTTVRGRVRVVPR